MTNNWYVITGASCSGKTTLIEALAKNGYQIIPEAARAVIEEGIKAGLSVAEIRQDEIQFQKKVLDLKIEIEKNLDESQTIFFDRGIPDSLAFYKLYGEPIELYLEEASRNSKYKKIFTLERLPYEKDEIRIESEEDQNKIHELLKKTYSELGFEVVLVPVLPAEKRVEWVLNNL